MSTPRGPGRERHRMILVAMAEVAGGTTRLCAYEDIVVRAWKMFPQEFGLRGYVGKYPDSSDLHKPLYGPLKRDGYVRVQNKKFGLTEAGLAVAAQLTGRTADRASVAGRVERDQAIEIERLGKKPAVGLVQQDRSTELLDTDLYDFYGVTVRTKPGDFAGRVNTVNLAIEAALQSQDPSLDRGRLEWIARTRDALNTVHGALITELSTPSDKTKH